MVFDSSFHPHVELRQTPSAPGPLREVSLALCFLSLFRCSSTSTNQVPYLMGGCYPCCLCQAFNTRCNTADTLTNGSVAPERMLVV